jgi:hypothetical protein
MTTLSPIEPDIEFIELEGLICDAANMHDVLAHSLHELFSIQPSADGFNIRAADGERLFFLSGMVTAMIEKAREAFYVALENDRKEGA